MSARSGKPDAAQLPEQRRHLVVDRILAGLSVPLTAVFSLVPGALVEDDGSGSPSIAFRLLVPDARAATEPARILDLEGHYPWLGVFVVVGVIVPPVVTGWLVLRRRTRPGPLLGFALTMLLLFGNIVPTAIGLYTYAAWFTDRRRLAAWSVAAAVALPAGMFTLGAIPYVLMAVVVPGSLGLWTGTRHLLVANLRERADQAEREQRLLAERAAAAERTRIAREMHDVVAHRVSLMVVHAGGLEVQASDPQAVETAGVIRTTGREALAELRDVLGVLRDSTDAPMTSPQPVLADLEQLIDGWRSAGMEITLDVTGPHRPLPEQTERSVYRVIQEGLTNASKHAPGAPVRVGLGYQDGAVEVTVVNALADGERRDPTEESSGGYGLDGLRERIALAGGRFTAGLDEADRWQVHAVIPTTNQVSGA